MVKFIVFKWINVIFGMVIWKVKILYNLYWIDKRVYVWIWNYVEV